MKPDGGGLKPTLLLLLSFSSGRARREIHARVTLMVVVVVLVIMGVVMVLLVMVTKRFLPGAAVADPDQNGHCPQNRGVALHLDLHLPFRPPLLGVDLMTAPQNVCVQARVW